MFSIIFHERGRHPWKIPWILLILLFNAPLHLTVFSSWPSVHRLQLTAFSLWPSAYRLQLTAFSFWPSAYGLQPMAFSLRPSAYSLQPIAFSLLLVLLSSFCPV